MYEDILNFLKSKNKKLTEEEASEFIRLLAESVGCDEEITIHSTLDNSDEEISTEYNLVIDNFNMDSYSEDDSFSLDGLSDEEEEDKEYIVLNKRKIKRAKDFKRQKINEVSVENDNNKKVENGNSNKVENQFMKKSVGLKKENYSIKNNDILKKKGFVNDIEKIQKDEKKIKEFVKKNSTEKLNDKDEDKKIPFSLPKDFNISNANFQVIENNDKIPFNLPENSDKPKFEFKLPQMDTNKKFEFKLPKFDYQVENEEFKFDLGDLIDVNNTGPDYKFYDEDNNEL